MFFFFIYFKVPMTIKVLPSECSAMEMRRSDRYRCCCDSHILEPGSMFGKGMDTDMTPCSIKYKVDMDRYG